LDARGAEGVKTGKGLDGSIKDVETDGTCQIGFKIFDLFLEVFFR